jgi:hypothetical protein
MRDAARRRGVVRAVRAGSAVVAASRSRVAAVRAAAAASGPSSTADTDAPSYTGISSRARCFGLAAPASRARAGVLSVLFVISYLALGIPAVLAGYGLTHHGDIFATAREFSSAVMVLAALALAATFRGAFAARSWRLPSRRGA